MAKTYRKQMFRRAQQGRKLEESLWLYQFEDPAGAKKAAECMARDAALATIHRQMYLQELCQADIVNRVGGRTATICNVLQGNFTPHIKTLAWIALAMNCKVEINFIPMTSDEMSNMGRYENWKGPPHEAKERLLPLDSNDVVSPQNDGILPEGNSVVPSEGGSGGSAPAK